MLFDMSRNYLWWDNTESVTVDLIRNGGTSSVTIAVAKRSQITTRDLTDAGVQLDSTDIPFNIPESLLNPAANGREILRGDVITDSANRRYRVQTSQLLHRQSRWRVICRKEL